MRCKKIPYSWQPQLDIQSYFLAEVRTKSSDEAGQVQRFRWVKSNEKVGQVVMRWDKSSHEVGHVGQVQWWGGTSPETDEMGQDLMRWVKSRDSDGSSPVRRWDKSSDKLGQVQGQHGISSEMMWGQVQWHGISPEMRWESSVMRWEMFSDEMGYI